MSNFVERTFGSLNTILNSSLFTKSREKTANVTKLLSPWTPEIAFLERLKNSESKREEENEVSAFKLAAEKRLADVAISNAEIAGIVMQCMICERLGYSVPFIYVHAIKLAQKGNIHEKHTGYLAASVFLHPEHELVILLINTMQKDICSSNHAEVLLGLISVCNLISVETVHNVIHHVEDKLNHKLSSVRKLAVMTLGHCVELINSPSSFQIALPKLEKALMDTDLSVVSAAVPVVFSIVQKLPGDYSYLLDGLIYLQDQIIQRRIPSNMMYNDIPCPWLQIQILKFLSLICRNCQQTENVVAILKKTLLQAEVKHYMAFAIIQETIEAATHIEASAELTQLVLSSIHKFLTSNNFNLKLIGMESLISVVKNMKPSIDAAQQEIIMECLKQPDETLQLKTLDLLYHLANESNVSAICKKLIEFIVSKKDECLQKRLSLKVMELAKKHKDNKSWFVSIVNIIFTESDHVLSSTDINSIIAIVEKDVEMKKIALNIYLDMKQKNLKFSPSMIKLVAIVLSSIDEFQDFLPYLMKEADESSSLWLLVSFQLVLLSANEIPETLFEMLNELPRKFESVSEAIFQIVICVTDSVASEKLKKIDISKKIDPSLSFLDEYVVNSLEKGSSCYVPQSLRVAVTAEKDYKQVESSSASSSKVSLICDSESTIPKSPLYNAVSSSSISIQSFSSDVDSKSEFSSDFNLAKGDQAAMQSETLEKDEALTKECLELFAGVS